MNVDLNELVVPLLSSGAGGAAVLAVAKAMLKSAIKRYEKLQDLVRDNDKAIAVLQYQIASLEKDLTGVAHIARRNAAPAIVSQSGTPPLGGQ